MNDGLPAEYWEACRLAREGLYSEARRIYVELEVRASADRRLAGLIGNDLAVLAALEGRIDEAHQGWLATLKVDEDCLPARLNRDFLQAEVELAASGADAVRAELRFAPKPTPATGHLEPNTGPVRVAIVSFLFNWPTTGGGNVHTGLRGDRPSYYFK